MLTILLSKNKEKMGELPTRTRLLFDPFQAEEVLQVVEILIRSDECGAEYVSGSGNPKVIFAHVSGSHALWEGERWVLALTVCVDVGVGFVDAFRRYWSDFERG